ncbi:MAG: phosphoribosylformylglycinamidine synthase subunit PurL [Caldisericia bacterium]|nr:phosphoribosylformylglycinamidine synthase subunit PurL [Caldisericia bacterium]MDD4614373.1 phosphoribosylformylglycinamidine synthase subunit PurL [Caldisericia bacterium]
MNSQLLKELNLDPHDYQEIVRRLKKEPKIVELGLFSAMWSEHCSYRSSKKYLSQLYTKGDQVIEGPGENAGVVKLTDSQYLTFKVESHNHPSAVEPFQGAATGVGGIIRDIFTMGARPIAGMDSLHFDYPNSARSRFLLNGVVEGISFYGNCVGVPTIGGETHFASCYDENPLVNAMVVGILDKANLRRSIAKTPGAKVIYLGAKTGRDGLHGASFASGVLDEDRKQRKGSVQVGDPFLEKLLIEATLEIIQEDLVEAIQDMGAAGITSSSVEMAGKGELGIRIDLDKVPRREPGITPIEIMLSESQERMLLIAKQGKESQIKEILGKWELDYAEIGIITETGCIEIFTGETCHCNVPIQLLLDPPENTTKPIRNPRIKTLVSNVPNCVPVEQTEAVLLQQIKNPNFGSKHWIHDQYDSTLFAGTVEKPGLGPSCIHIHGTDQYVGMALLSRGELCSIDPYEGAKTVCAIAARRITSLGLTPTAITNCLNFGDPTQEHTMWEFSESIKGMNDALSVLKAPVVSGNVSFYNEGEKQRIYPTPVIGMIGTGSLPNKPTLYFPQSGLICAVVGKTKKEYIQTDSIPRIDILLEKKTQDIIRQFILESTISSCISIDRGGLWYALVKSMLPKHIGLHIYKIFQEFTPGSYLLSESNSRYLIAFPSDHLDRIQNHLHGIAPLDIIGKTIENRFIIEGVMDLAISTIKEWHHQSLTQYFE